MTYVVKAIIPLEMGFPTLRSSSFTPSNNDGLLEKSLDLVEERRESAMVQLGLLSTQALVGIRCQRKTETTSNSGLGFKKSFRNYKESSIGKVGTQLGRVASYHISVRNRCVLS